MRSFLGTRFRQYWRGRQGNRAFNLLLDKYKSADNILCQNDKALVFLAATMWPKKNAVRQ